MTDDQQHHLRNGIVVCKYLCQRIRSRFEPGSITRAEAETMLNRLKQMSQCMEEPTDVSLPE